jgi:hypothetical protein
LALALHVRQHRNVPGTQLITTTESYTGSQSFTPIPNLLAVLAITPSHIILDRVEELYSLADAVDNVVKEKETDKAIQIGRYLQRSGVMDKNYVHLKTPWELLVAGFRFMDVINSQGLWSVFKGNQPQLVLLTSRTSWPADGFEIHHSPSQMVTPSSSDSSASDPELSDPGPSSSDPDPESSDPGTTSDLDSESEPPSGPPSTGPPDLVSDSNEASEEEDDQEGMGTVMGTVRTKATALVNVRQQLFGRL